MGHVGIEAQIHRTLTKAEKIVLTALLKREHGNVAIEKQSSTTVH